MILVITSASVSEYVSQRGSETLYLVLTYFGGSLYLSVL